MASSENETTEQLFTSEPMDSSAFELLAQVPEDGDESAMVDLPPALHDAVTKTEGNDDVGPDDDENIDDDSDEDEVVEAENLGQHQNHPALPQLSPSHFAVGADPDDSDVQVDSSLPMVLRTDSLATSNRPFPCMVCGKRFTQKAHLIIHKRTHTGEKPYACHICHKRFAQSSHLTVHKRVHTGEKPFFCNFCGMGFCRRPRLESHILQHVVKEGRNVPASMRNQMLASLSMGNLGGNSSSGRGLYSGRRGARGRGRGRSRGFGRFRSTATRGSSLMSHTSPPYSQANNDSILSDLKSEILDVNIETNEDDIDAAVEDDEGDNFTEESDRGNFGSATRRFANAGRGPPPSAPASQQMNYDELDRFMGTNANGSIHNRSSDAGSLTMTGLVRTNSRVSLVDFTAPDIMQHLMSRDDIKSCDYCCIVFSDPAMYYLHRCMHDKMDVRRCNMCGKMAADKYDFMAHFLSQHK